AWIRNAVGAARVYIQLRRDAEALERHEQFLRLRTRYARISFDNMDHRRRLRVPDVLERRLIPVRFEIIVRQLVAEVELPDTLYVTLGVHRDPVRGAGPGADRLEAISVGENPVG